MAAAENVRVVKQKEGFDIRDQAARRYLKMSGTDFLEAWDAGAFAGKADIPEVMRVAMLIPFVR